MAGYHCYQSNSKLQNTRNYIDTGDMYWFDDCMTWQRKTLVKQTKR